MSNRLIRNSGPATELARGMFGDTQAEHAGLDQPADIAQRSAAL
jgi:hypothetical protein